MKWLTNDWFINKLIEKIDKCLVLAQKKCENIKYLIKQIKIILSLRTMILFICPYIFCTVDVSSFVYIDRENWFLRECPFSKSNFQTYEAYRSSTDPRIMKGLRLKCKV